MWLANTFNMPFCLLASFCPTAVVSNEVTNTLNSNNTRSLDSEVLPKHSLARKKCTIFYAENKED